MRLISRSVLREIWPPFLLGFTAYTFILLVRQIILMTDFLVRRAATFREVLWLVVLSVPWIVVLTLPMAYLLGLLIGLGRLAADSEIIALRSCGVEPRAIFRPVFAAAGALSPVRLRPLQLGSPESQRRPDPRPDAGWRQPRPSTSSSRASSGRSGPASPSSLTASARTTAPSRASSCPLPRKAEAGWSWPGPAASRSRETTCGSTSSFPSPTSSIRRTPPATASTAMPLTAFSSRATSGTARGPRSAMRRDCEPSPWESFSPRLPARRALPRGPAGTGSPGSRSTRSSRFPWRVSRLPSWAFRSPRRRAEADAAGGSPCRS